ncbi:MAG: hypothetical protein Q8M92_10710 [Candidatus Subteraquimicrobiales bacterium]|nr:hypothetical protein [Candidatus Subteraquimicrobiales bacterium]
MPISSGNFDPEELLDVAKELSSFSEESKIRTVLNRCYYSCYLSIKEKKGLIEIFFLLVFNIKYYKKRVDGVW